ncbi:MAG: DNA recombination protein RmuC [Bacteroidales bacterium]|nr:DNA recombination protein RmuC [Bacteroidales bacterium]
MDFIFIGIGLILGGTIVFLALRIAASGTKAKMEENIRYLSQDNQDLKSELEGKDDTILELNRGLATATNDIDHLNEKLNLQKDEINELHKQFKVEFENLANKIFEDKSQKFVKLNHEKLETLLNPLKEKIGSFEKKVEDTYEKETREMISLKKELENIVKLNQQISEEASRLTLALKGDSKSQGDWGELQVEKILERSGLSKGIHFTKQGSLRDDDGSLVRPDFLISLPDDKHLVLDSKVSLTAYEKYFNADDETDRKKYFGDHISSIKKHISELSKKNYQSLYDINPPDYILMFLPLEGAFSSALKEDSGIYLKALDQNIVVVTTTTLLATLRTVAFMWKQEVQKSNVYEIARESGKLYDKFVGFVEDLEEVGKKIDDSAEKYHDAMNKLKTSPKKGDTIIGRIERIKSLGANTTKSIPSKFLDENGEEEE